MDSSRFRYNHLGVPSKEPLPGETYLPRFKMYVSGYGENDFNVERMRFEDDSPIPKIVREMPHAAFEVDDLDEALKGREILIHPNSPSEGLRVAFIMVNGVPVELMQFSK
jgi:hypothetical protein